MSSKIRMIEENDIERVREIYAPYIEQTTVSFEYEVPDPATFKKRVKTVMEKYPWLVYEKDGQVIGYAYASDYRTRTAFSWDAELSVYLSEKSRGQGIGKKLYRALIAVLEELGYYNAYGVVAQPNEGSERLHEAFGFIKEGTQINAGFKHDKWVNLCYYRKPLREYDRPQDFPRSIKALQAEEIERILENE